MMMLCVLMNMEAREPNYEGWREGPMVRARTGRNGCDEPG
jgi:hypothetical protein